MTPPSSTVIRRSLWIVDLDAAPRHHHGGRSDTSGLGWETCGVSVTRTVRLPCATATRLMRTFSPMTTMPLPSSITMRAGWSGSTRSCSTSLIRVGGAPAKGRRHGQGSRSPGRWPTPCPAPNRPLIAFGDALGRREVGIAQRHLQLVQLVQGRSRSRARRWHPPAAVPTVGTPRVTESAWPCAS